MDKKTNDVVLTCGIARDLLPLYLDGLTSPESAAALEAHLASCPDCRALRAALETPLPGAEESPAARSAGDGAGTDGAPPQTEVAEKVLKRAARRGWRKALAVMVVIALLIVGGMRFWDWGMGTPVPQKHIQIHAVCPIRDSGGGKVTSLLLLWTLDEEYSGLTFGGGGDQSINTLSLTYKPFSTWAFDYDPAVWQGFACTLLTPAQRVILNGILIWSEEENGDAPTPEYARYLLSLGDEALVHVGEDAVTICSDTEYHTWSYDDVLLGSGPIEELEGTVLTPAWSQ